MAEIVFLRGVSEIGQLSKWQTVIKIVLEVQQGVQPQYCDVFKV